MLTVVFVAVVSASLRILGFRRTYAWIERTAVSGGSARSGDANTVPYCVSAMQRLKRYVPWTGRCLARSLTLWWMLRRRGLPAQLHIGLRLEAGQLTAHAWAVLDDRPLAEPAASLRGFSGRLVIA